jgi:hypothetical protein
MRKRAEATLQEGYSLENDQRSTLANARIVREMLEAREAARKARYQATMQDDDESSTA